jgi:hypothetical protein
MRMRTSAGARGSSLYPRVSPIRVHSHAWVRVPAQPFVRHPPVSRMRPPTHPYALACMGACPRPGILVHPRDSPTRSRTDCFAAAYERARARVRVGFESRRHVAWLGLRRGRGAMASCIRWRSPSPDYSRPCRAWRDSSALSGHLDVGRAGATMGKPERAPHGSLSQLGHRARACARGYVQAMPAGRYASRSRRAGRRRAAPFTPSEGSARPGSPACPGSRRCCGGWRMRGSGGNRSSAPRARRSNRCRSSPFPPSAAG